MDDRTKWIEWLGRDKHTAMTCYEGAGISWDEAYGEFCKLFVPYEDPIDLQAFDLLYQQEISEYGVYGFRLCGDYWLTICYFNDDVTLYKSTDDAYWENNEILLRFDRERNIFPHRLVDRALKEIKPYLYNLLFPMTVQTTDDEA